MQIRKLFLSGVAACAMILTACGGGGETSSPPPNSGGGGGVMPPPPPPPPPPPQSFATDLDTTAEASRFLLQAGFGGTMSELEALVDTNATRWLEREFAKTRTDLLFTVRSEFQTTGEVEFNRASEVYWDALFSGDDELRQRMTFALSQIFVISDFQVGQTPLSSAYYRDIISQNAFGNFRDLLEDVTYSPAMADFLTYMRNRKGDPETGRVPDENYAREILQLFTIGLVELNMDGTPKLQNGQEIPTYDNDDIRGLARVFTGLGLAGDNFYAYSPGAHYRPMQMYDDQHSELEKSFLGTTIPAGTGGTETVDMALDVIFEHENVPPFFARQLIQRFTASNPSPAYVERVATAFANGSYTATDGTVFGTGDRGDLQATLAAVLLDNSVHREPGNLPRAGKVREPILKFVQWAHNFDVARPITEEEYRLWDTGSPATGLGQHPFRPPSVFNFYRPGYIAPGTQAGDAGMTTPEFQIVNEGAALGYINFMTDFIVDFTGGDEDPERFTPDYRPQLDLAEDPAALVEHLNIIMTAGQMTPEEITVVQDTISEIEIETDQDRLNRVRVSILMVASLPSYAVIE